jgi:hypothetical protein
MIENDRAHPDQASLLDGASMQRVNRALKIWLGVDEGP